MKKLKLNPIEDSNSLTGVSSIVTDDLRVASFDSFNSLSGVSSIHFDGTEAYVDMQFQFPGGSKFHLIPTMIGYATNACFNSLSGVSSIEFPGYRRTQVPAGVNSLAGVSFIEEIYIYTTMHRVSIPWRE